MNSTGLLAAGDAGGGASNPILPVWNEIIWGGAAFAILFIAMAKFAYPAIKKAMEARSEKIQGDLDAADTRAPKRKVCVPNTTPKLQRLKLRRQEFLKQHELKPSRFAKTVSQQLNPKSRRSERKQMRISKPQRLVRLPTFEHRVTSLAVGAAEQVVKSSLDEAAYARLVDDYIESVGN